LAGFVFRAIFSFDIEKTLKKINFTL